MTPKVEPPKDEIAELKRDIIIELSNAYFETYRYDRPNDSVEQLSAFCRDIATNEVDELLKLQQEAARIDERTQFIKDDKNGRNAVYIAKQKQLHFHDHYFDLSSYICSCGISIADAQELDKLTPKELNKLRLEL